MIRLALNTHAFVKRLKAANMTEEQAEVIVDGINAARETDLATLATKADLAALAAATKSDLKELELRFDARFEKVIGEITLLKWMMGLVIAGIVALILKAYFPH